MSRITPFAQLEKKSTTLSNWLAEVEWPERVGTHKRALAPAAKPTLLGDMPTLGSDTAAGKDMTMTGPGSGVAAGVPVQSSPAFDFSKAFRKYHGTPFDPNSAMDKGKMEQLRALQAQYGTLSQSLVYDRQYGTKSASITAFAALELEKSAFVGQLFRTVGGALSRSATAAQKAHKLGFQNYYKNLDDATRVANPGLGQRALRYQSSSPAEIGKRYNIGQWRQNFGSKLQTAGNELGVMRYTDPSKARLIDATAGAGALGAGALGAGALGAGEAEAKTLDDAFGARGAGALGAGALAGHSVTKYASIPAFAMLEGDAEKNASVASVLQKGLNWGARRLGSSAHKARVALKGKADDAGSAVYDATLKARSGQRGMAGRGIAEENARVAGQSVMDKGRHVGNRRSGAANLLHQAANKISTSPALKGAINYGTGAVGGGALLYGSNRLGHNQGREAGVSEGYDAGAEAALSSIPEQPGYFGGVLQALTGRQATDPAAARNMSEQSKSDILSRILRGRE